MLQKMTHEEVYIERLSYERTSGYWKVAGRSFFEKINCLKYASKIKNYNVTYHLFDSAYASLDWTKEPTHSLDELYKLRAQQIRDKYNYVMLAFSGGADSLNVLNTFIENNIHVDEVVSYYPIKAIEKLLPTFNENDRSAENNIFEYVKAAKPKLEWLAKHRPNIKITIIDPTEFVQELILSDTPEKLVKYGQTFTVLNAGEIQLSRMLKSYSEKYNNACCIYGIDKPTLRYDPIKNRIGVCMGDFAHNKCKFVIDGYRPIIEPFYSTPDMPEIAHAQGKAVSKLLLPMLNEKHRIPAVQALLEPTLFSLYKIDEHTDIIKKILYKNWNPEIWQCSVKPVNHFKLEYDSWFHDTNLIDNRTKDFFRGQHKNWVYNVDDHFIRKDANGIPIGFRPYASRIFWC